MSINDNDKNFIRNNSEKYSINEIYYILKQRYSKEMIRNFCKNNGLKYRKLTKAELSHINKTKNRKQYNRTSINHNYFKTWSKNMAYIFGLWCADGNIGTQSNGYQFSIKLHKNDRYLLQQILDEMQSEHIIYDKKDNCCEIIIGSKTIYYDIISLGGKEQKSLDLKFPNVPKEFLFDFIRGYFDGDGSVIKTYRCAKFYGNYDFISELKDILELYNIKSCKIYDIHETKEQYKNKLFGIQIREKQSFYNLYKLMYNDINNCLYLKRKYEIFSKHILSL